MNNFKLGILGVGKMGGSILEGILRSNIYKPSEICIFDVNQEINNKYQNIGLTVLENEYELVKQSVMVLLAIKPQMFSCLTKYTFDLQDKVIISIVAGKTLKDLENIFGKQQFIRVMPNTPSLINCGATAISKTDNINEEVFQKVKSIFESIGVVSLIDDNLMNEVIPLNGSMPAYLYYFAKGFIENGVSKGIDYETAKLLCCHAIIGSAKMILETNKPIDELIKDVCSPKGATLEGIKVLDDNNVNKIINDTCDACIKRAYELSNL